jgi:hypothetical protein
MAIWQFSCDLLPETAVRMHLKDIPLVIRGEQFDQILWWDSWPRAAELTTSIQSLLNRAPSWSERVDIWGDIEGDTIQIYKSDAGAIEEVFVRVDVRSLSHVFLNGVVVMAQRHGLLIRTEDGHILRPDLKELIAALRRSRSCKFVRDPAGFFASLKQQLERNE